MLGATLRDAPSTDLFATTESTAAPANIPSSQRVWSFLQEIFLQGEKTGNEANPADVAPKMKRLR